MSRYRTGLVILVAVLAGAAGCSSDATPPASPTASPAANQVGPGGSARSQTAMPSADTVVLPGTSAVDLAVATSKALFVKAPAVVLVGETDRAKLASAGKTATKLGVPLLLTPATTANVQAALPSPPAGGSGGAGANVRAELTRLAPSTVLAVGDAANAWQRGANAPSPAPTVTVTDSGDQSNLPDVTPAAPLKDLLVLTSGAASAAAAVTAQAAGARLVQLDSPDPRASSASIKALTGQASAKILAVGSQFGSAEQLRNRVATAATGVELPGGGQLVFPGRRMVALYGHPGNNILGSLGEQDLPGAIARARKVAGAYSALSKEPVVPAFEIIATVAAASAGPDGNYSNEASIGFLKPWVDAAKKNGIYVVLDLQPGRTDFLTQAKRYQDLLLYPNVGLALDPEWRVGPKESPAGHIGSVDASEINHTAQWLDDLTSSHHLPQKVLMVHQFRLDMITHRSALVTTLDSLRVVIHADGFGSTPQKFNTWNALHLDAPGNIVWGWKNFYDEDKPTLTPAQTMAVRPAPVFISYQ